MIRLKKSSQLIIEKSLISFSFVYFATFFWEYFANIGTIYLSILILFYTMYFYVSRIKLEISLATILIGVLLCFMLYNSITKCQFEYRRCDYYKLLILFIILQFNNIVFKKHVLYSIKLLLLTIVAFAFALFFIFLFFKNDAVFLLERCFKNTNVFAVFVALCAIIFSSYSKMVNIRYIKFVSFVLLIIAALCVLILESRTAIIMLAIYLILDFIKQKKVEIIKSMFLSLGLLSLILFFVFFTKTDSTSGRFFIWKTSMAIVEDNLIQGVGYNSFASTYPLYQALKYEMGHMNEKEIYLVDNTSIALNEYLQTLVELGILGLLLFVSIIGVYVLSGKENALMYLCICLAMMFCYILHSFIIVYLIVIVLSLSFVPPLLEVNKRFYFGVLGLIFFWTVQSICFFENKYRSTKTVELLWKQSPERINIYYDLNKKYLCDDAKLILTLSKYNYTHNNIDRTLILLNQLDYLVRRNDIELLRGICYEKKGLFKLAEKHFLLSVAICPNRFINRYELFKFYESQGLTFQAMKTAKEIFALKEKVPSAHTLAIKEYISRYLNKKNTD